MRSSAKITCVQSPSGTMAVVFKPGIFWHFHDAFHTFLKYQHRRKNIKPPKAAFYFPLSVSCRFCHSSGAAPIEHHPSVGLNPSSHSVPLIPLYVPHSFLSLALSRSLFLLERTSRDTTHAFSVFAAAERTVKLQAVSSSYLPDRGTPITVRQVIHCLSRV